MSRLIPSKEQLIQEPGKISKTSKTRKASKTSSVISTKETVTFNKEMFVNAIYSLFFFVS